MAPGDIFSKKPTLKRHPFQTNHTVFFRLDRPQVTSIEQVYSSSHPQISCICSDPRTEVSEGTGPSLSHPSRHPARPRGRHEPASASRPGGTRRPLAPEILCPTRRSGPCCRVPVLRSHGGQERHGHRETPPPSPYSPVQPFSSRPIASQRPPTCTGPGRSRGAPRQPLRKAGAAPGERRGAARPWAPWAGLSRDVRRRRRRVM